MLKQTGVPIAEEVLSCFPSDLRKPKAIIECYQEIPCNPCETSCPFHAITIGEDINARPQIDFDKCTGCGICVYSCPGLAISVAQVVSNQATFKIPYEFTPLPKKGEIWDGLNRSGDKIANVTIEHVLYTPKQNKTAMVTVSMDAKHLHEFITIRCPQNE